MLNRNFAIALAAAMVLAVLYGCSSNGGIKSDRDMYKEQAEMLQGDLDTANADITRLMGELTTALNDADDDGVNDEVARLMGELTTALNDADGDGVNDEVARLMGELTTAQNDADGDGVNDEVARLMGELTTAQNDADGDGVNDEVARLMGELTTAQNDADGDGVHDEVARLMGELTTAQNDADGDGVNDEVARLMGELTTAQNDADGDGVNDEVTRLMGELTTAQNDADGDGVNDEVTRLMGELTTAQNDADGDGVHDEVTRLMGELTTALNDGNDDGENDDVTALNEEVAAYATAQDASDAAKEAGTAATDAVTTATDSSGMITTLDVMGDSGMAEDQAQAVLDAKDAVDAAVIAADNALKSAQHAKDALPDATDPPGALDRALDAAIAVAKAQLEIAENLADPNEPEGQALEMALELVNGDDPEADGYPTTPATHGKNVAMAVGGSLMPISASLGGGVRVTPTENPSLPEGHEPKDNHVGKTWKEIVEAGGVMTEKRRIANTIDDTNEVDVALFVNMPTDSVDSEPTGAGLEEGAEHEGNYMGIEGFVICAAECAVTVGSDTVSRLTGTWYFTPLMPMSNYVKDADGEYEVENTFAEYGYWLSGTDADPIINIYAKGGEDNTNTLGLALGRNADTLTDAAATYNGSAVGISLHKELDTDGVPVPGTLQSGEFTASVELTATFGDEPTLGGMITDFVGPGVVDGEWEVILLTRGIDDGDPTFNDGTSVASAQDGVWTTTGFGRPAERPMGFFGTFNAHFTDGHAAGAYATREE